MVQRDTLNVDFMMRNVPIQLDGTGQKTQKKKPKRKEVSAKKKRIHGIYNISTANQRFVDDHCTNYYLFHLLVVVDLK